jgi:hypothetical protein
MKEYECVQVRHHKDVAATIEERQRKGWRLHTYQAAGDTTAINHYLLLEKAAPNFTVSISHVEAANIED